MNKRLLTALAFAIGLLTQAAAARADGAILCTHDSTGGCKDKPYCCYSGGESEGDKWCKSLGCVRGGTSSSCPNAANVKSCGTRNVSIQPKEATKLAMCVEPMSVDTRTL